MKRAPTVRRSQGFTLIEIVVALSISAVLVGFITYFITAPMDAYVDHAARARQTEASENISRMMLDDLRAALPNSVRVRNVGNRAIVEMLHVGGMAYFQPQGVLPAAGTLSDTTRGLNFGAADNEFSAFGSIAPNIIAPAYPTPGVLLGGHLVIGSLGYNTPADPYQLGAGAVSVITPAGTDIRLSRDPVSREETLNLSPPFRFTNPAPVNVLRVFWVDKPIAYICNANANARTLRRYSGYAISANPPANENAAQLSGGQQTLLADNIGACRFACLNEDVCPGTLVIDMSLVRAQPDGDETLRIVEQVALDNNK